MLSLIACVSAVGGVLGTCRSQSLSPQDSSSTHSRTSLEFGILSGLLDGEFAAGGFVATVGAGAEVEANLQLSPMNFGPNYYPYTAQTLMRLSLTYGRVAFTPLADLSISIGPALTTALEPSRSAFITTGSFIGAATYSGTPTTRLGGTIAAALKFHLSERSAFRVQGSLTGDAFHLYESLVGTLGYRF